MLSISKVLFCETAPLKVTRTEYVVCSEINYL